MTNKHYFKYNAENNMVVIYMANDDVSIAVMWVDATYVMYRYGGSMPELANAVYIMMEKLGMEIER